MTSAGLAQLEWSATYRPFGEAHAITGSQSLTLRFPGQLFDPETGFHQNWFRDYDPRLGRYVQPDPIGLKGGLNAYAYAGGDPANQINPEGLQEALVRSLPLAGGAAAADGPLPVGDAIALGLLGGALVYDVCTIAWDRVFSGGSTLTDKIGKIASEIGLTPRQVKEAIHRAKRNMPRSTDRRNPDVAVDTATEEIYPQNPDGSYGDSIGNVFDD